MTLEPEEERALVAELAQAVVARAAPEELAIFDETVEEYFRDPDGVLHARGRDEAVGFGLELGLLSPYVLAIASSVVSFLVSTIADSAKEESKTLLAPWIRRLFTGSSERGREPAEDSRPLTPEQGRRVRKIAYERATVLGLPAATADVLADAVVGGVLVSE